MLNFCDFIQVYVFTTNHHLNSLSTVPKTRIAEFANSVDLDDHEVAHYENFVICFWVIKELSIGTYKTFNFPLRTNGKLIVFMYSNT